MQVVGRSHTRDPGGAESVLPPRLVPREMLREGSARRAGGKFMAAFGMAARNHGETRVRFKTVELDGVQFE